MNVAEHIALALYRLLAWALQPWVKRRMLARAAKEPLYGQWLPERFGQGEPANWGKTRPVWIHAVSLGETRAATQLLAALSMDTWTSEQKGAILLTHGTATGREAGAAWIAAHAAKLGLHIHQSWQPWDNTASVQRFLRLHNPSALWLMETEVWPNMVACCNAAGIPVALVNARMSEKTLAQSLKLRWLSRPSYAALTQVLAQTVDDSARLQQAGATVQEITGNIKFDASPNTEQLKLGQSWRALRSRPVVMFASSREGEELPILKAFHTVVHSSIHFDATENVANERLRLLLVPRHPQRFDEVARIVTQLGLSLSRRSGWPASGPDESAFAADVWLGDTLGEMALYASMSQVALLGGSFAPLGGQNLIELLACGCPVVMGPHTYNFADAAERAELAGVAVRVADAAQALDTAQSLIGQTRLSSAAIAFVAQNAGAVAKTVAALRQ